MSQHVTCPKCKHQFEIDDLSERYERYIAKLTGGTLTPKNTPAIDVIGKDGETYQVKYSKAKNNWGWDISKNGVDADFFVCFGVSKNDVFIFLIPEKIVKKRMCKSRGNYHHDCTLTASKKLDSWIWDYRVSPNNFMARVAELKASQQLALEFTKGLGD